MRGGAGGGEEAASEVGSDLGRTAESSVRLRSVSIKTGRQGALLHRLRPQTPRPDERKLQKWIIVFTKAEQQH